MNVCLLLFDFVCRCFCIKAEKLIDRRVAEIVNQVQRGEPTESMYLTKLLSSDQMSRADVNVTVTELLLGGVDTVRGSLCCFYDTQFFIVFYCPRGRKSRNIIQANVCNTTKQRANNRKVVIVSSCIMA